MPITYDAESRYMYIPSWKHCIAIWAGFWEASSYGSTLISKAEHMYIQVQHNKGKE